MKLAALAFVVLAAASNVTGTWDVEVTFDDARINGGGFYCAFVQSGDRITGSCSEATAEVSGTIKGQNISWRIQKRGDASTPATTFTGTVNDAGVLMTGRFIVGDKGGRFAAKKL